MTKTTKKSAGPEQTLDQILPSRYRKDPEALISDYLAICNQVLKNHADQGQTRQALRLAKRANDGEPFTAIVYDNHPDEVLGEFPLRFDPEAREISLSRTDPEDSAFSWKVPLSYLSDVVLERPTWYLQHPLMLDWKWLTQRIGDEVTEPLDARSLAVGALLGAAGFYAGQFAVRAVRTRGAKSHGLRRMMPGGKR